MSYPLALLLTATVVFTNFATCESSTAITLRLSIDEERPEGTVVANMVNIFGLLLEERAGRHFKLLEQQLKSNLGSPRPRHGLVTVDRSTGIIKLRKRIDRDQLCGPADECFLKVQAVMLPQRFFSLLNLEVVINDVNDNSPVFPTNPIEVNISESASIGDVINLNQFQARDIDSGNNSMIKYSISSNQFFRVEQKVIEAGNSQLQLVLLKELDFEAKPLHHVKLTASDLGEPPKFNHVTISIRLIDFNDNEPVFESRTYVVSLLENLSPGVEIVQVQAHDIDKGDNARLSYRIVDDSHSGRPSVGNRLLSINADTGAVSLLQKLDREEHDGLRIQLEVQDKGTPQLSSHAWLVLQIGDVNDNLPVIKQNFIIKSNKNTAYLSEASPNGTYVAYVSASDADNGLNGDVKLTIKTIPFLDKGKYERDTGHFVLASDGLIRTGRQFDRETENRYKIIATACDDGTPQRCAVSNITIEILDENDNSPVFDQPVYDVTMSEFDDVGSYVITVSAKDSDKLNGPVEKLDKNGFVVPSTNGDITYSIDGLASPFSIDKFTGRIVLVRSLDWEGQSEWKVPLTAKDDGDPMKFGKSLLRVNVIDINDNRPLFTNPTFNNSSIFASTQSNDIITQIKTVDYDSDFFSAVELKLVSVDGNNVKDTKPCSSLFILDSTTGDLRLNRSYDDLAGTVGEHYILIEATDSGSPPLSNRIGLFIQVTDSLTFPTVVQNRIKSPSGASSISLLTIIIIVSLACFVVFVVLAIFIAVFKCRKVNKEVRTYNCRAAENQNGCVLSAHLASSPKQEQQVRSEATKNGDAMPRVSASEQSQSNEVSANQNLSTRKSFSEVASRNCPVSDCKEPQDGSNLYTMLTSVDRVPTPSTTMSFDGTHCVSKNRIATSMPRLPLHNIDMDSGRGDSEVDTTSYGGTTERDYERLLKYSTPAKRPFHSTPSDTVNSLGRFCTEECRYYGHSDSCWMPNNDFHRPPINSMRKGLETINESSPHYTGRNEDVQYPSDIIRARAKRNMFLSLGEPMARPYKTELENYHSEDLSQQCHFWPEDNGTPLSSVFSSANPSPAPSPGHFQTTFHPHRFRKSEGDENNDYKQEDSYPKENYLSVTRSVK